jgi:hypothetical protein
MQLSTEAEVALDAWLGASTWHSGHDADMDRWYVFVDRYQRDHGFHIDEPALQGLIEKKPGGNVTKDLKHVIRENISLAFRILDFLKCTNR